MIDRFFYKVFGALDNALLWVSTLFDPKCKCKRKKKK